MLEQLVRLALEQLRDVAGNPPPLRLGNHLLTRVAWHRWESDEQCPPSLVVIGGAPPSPNCRPVGIIWLEE